VNALSGTGVGRGAAPLLPDPPAGDAPPEALLDVDERVVPEGDVVALEEIEVDVLAVVSTVAFEPVVELGESADVDATLDTAGVVTLPGDSAEVDDGGVDTPTVDEGVKSALPEEGVTPDPAPDEDPAVLDATADDELPVNEDWI
jgi:hypothetical protein